MVDSVLSKVYHLTKGTVAVLIATAYSWICPDCKHNNLASTAFSFMECENCVSLYKVSTVFHLQSNETPSIGTPPDKLFVGKFPHKQLPYALEENEASNVDLDMASSNANGEVTIEATGYSWRCPECDKVNYRGVIEFSDVACNKCSSIFLVFEARHKVNDMDIGFRIYPGAKWHIEEVLDDAEEQDKDVLDEEPADELEEGENQDDSKNTFFS